MHTIGIDFGTTKTLVSRIIARTGEPETVRLGQGTDHIPTSVFIMDNGEMMFGDEADDRITDPDGVYLRGFKMKLGTSTPVYAHWNEEGELNNYMASKLATRYLSYIRTRVQNTVFAGEPITRAIITRPVEFSPARCEELRQAAIAAGFDEVELTSEPEAAGLAFCRLNDTRAFHHSALIVDWGGGTLDFALVTRENNRIITHPHYTAGDTTMGGERFDEMLWNYAETHLRQQGINNVNEVAMLPIVRKNKEKLSSSQKTTLRLSHEFGACPPIELTQTLFNALIQNFVEQAAEKIIQLLESIPAADKPEMLILIGGSCHIPYIKDKLEEVCQLPAVSWHLSREAVSLGAALWNKEDTTPEKVYQQPTVSLPPSHEDVSLSAALWNKEKSAAQMALQSRKITEEQYSSKLITAARENDTELLRLLIEAGADVNAMEEEHGDTPLTLAAFGGHCECVSLLINSGANVNKKNKWDDTPLHRAVCGGHDACAELLIAAGAKVNKKNKCGQSPLLLAAEKGYNECMKLLIAANADLSPMDKEHDDTPLHKAAFGGHIECIKLLIAAESNMTNVKSIILTFLFPVSNFTKQLLKNAKTVARVNMKNKYGDTPLHSAVSGGHCECAQLLIDAGANVNEENKYGNSPLSIAKEKNHSTCIRLLEEAGAK